MLVRLTTSPVQDGASGGKETSLELLRSLTLANPTKRGPLLAQGYLALYARDEALLQSSLLAFIEAFGSRPCCVEDARSLLLCFAKERGEGREDVAPLVPNLQPANIAEEISHLQEQRRWPVEQVNWRVSESTRSALVEVLRGASTNENPR